MGDFTSKYKVTDGYGNASTQTRVDVGKSIDTTANALVAVLALTVGLWFGGFLWFIFRTAKEPKNISYKEMQEYGINTQIILTAKKKAWLNMIALFPIAIVGWLFYSRTKAKLQPLFEITKKFNDSFINSYRYAIEEKKQIINASLSVHGRDSQEYKNIAQQEFNDLILSIDNEFHFPLSVMKRIEEKSKEFLNIDFPIEIVLHVRTDEEEATELMFNKLNNDTTMFTLGSEPYIAMMVLTIMVLAIIDYFEFGNTFMYSFDTLGIHLFIDISNILISVSVYTYFRSALTKKFFHLKSVLLSFLSILLLVSLRHILSLDYYVINIYFNAIVVFILIYVIDFFVIRKNFRRYKS